MYDDAGGANTSPPCNPGVIVPEDVIVAGYRPRSRARSRSASTTATSITISALLRSNSLHELFGGRNFRRVIANHDGI